MNDFSVNNVAGKAFWTFNTCSYLLIAVQATSNISAFATNWRNNRFSTHDEPVFVQFFRTPLTHNQMKRNIDSYRVSRQSARGKVHRFATFRTDSINRRDNHIPNAANPILSEAVSNYAHAEGDSFIASVDLIEARSDVGLLMLLLISDFSLSWICAIKCNVARSRIAICAMTHVFDLLE